MVTEKTIKQAAMTYSDHLEHLITASLSAQPGLSARSLSVLAGLNPGWISEFRATRRFNSGRADLLIKAIREYCPTGPQGLEVRALLSIIDNVSAQGTYDQLVAQNRADTGTDTGADTGTEMQSRFGNFLSQGAAP